MKFLMAAFLVALAMGASTWADQIENDERRPASKGVDLRSLGRQIADQVRRRGLGVPPEAQGRADRGQKGRREEEGLDVQVNDPALDHLQTFPGTAPFEFSTQSETSIAAFGNNILIGYNSSADQPVVRTDRGLVFAHIHVSGFSVSHDGGRTWTSGFVPPVPGSPFTFGDPSVGVDRAGHFYYASLGSDADAPAFTAAVIINTSTDGGATFAPATVVARDDGSDKPWLAVGRDPVDRRYDNLYATWTSFQGNRSELRFARSTDGGATWSPQKTVFAPVDTGSPGLSAL
ncbi:MAG TPA: sialidase family protein, partial [Actinomycetota bacterium]|nr:sialidase family protein [Actinomycetota bacterium]